MLQDTEVQIVTTAIGVLQIQRAALELQRFANFQMCLLAREQCLLPNCRAFPTSVAGQFFSVGNFHCTLLFRAFLKALIAGGLEANLNAFSLLKI